MFSNVSTGKKNVVKGVRCVMIVVFVVQNVILECVCR
jgi:hypothetical protein